MFPFFLVTFFLATFFLVTFFLVFMGYQSPIFTHLLSFLVRQADTTPIRCIDRFENGRPAYFYHTGSKCNIAATRHHETRVAGR